MPEVLPHGFITKASAAKLLKGGVKELQDLLDSPYNFITEYTIGSHAGLIDKLDLQQHLA
ncbi:hypothetical protein [Rhodococcus sp. ANT_H53B]|uniref:hypothetical protein n=1 Tax=Rhodococcus sp. ANT_H53B TaxID=2597357 RepID=UPI0011EEB317|nr:hypothetical protein [Rhodococcus sp. ANT_H53B]KAA0925952.1 hypothetical protein FQ188_10380 [Rhodococcus sp. ANT_H53B]